MTDQKPVPLWGGPVTRRDQSNEILRLIYGAAFGTNTWRSALAGLGQELDGVRLAVWGHDTQANRNVGLIFHGFDPSFGSSWLDYYSSVNVWAAGLAAAPIGVLHTAEQLAPREALVSTEYYNDWLRPQEDILTGFGITLHSDKNRFFTFAANIRGKDEDKLKAPIAGLLKDLAPHLARAFSLTRILQDGISMHDFERVLDALPTAAIALDMEGRLCFINRAARVLVQTGRPAVIDQRGTLIFHDPAANLNMERLTAALRNRDFAAVPSDFQAIDTVTRSLFKIATTPFALEGDDGDVRGLFDARGRPAALVFIEPVAPDREQRARMMLAARFGLTPMEVELSWALYLGQTPAQIAERRSVSIHTVRNQLKAIFHKTGVNRQSQIVGLISEITSQNGLSAP